MVEHAPTVLYLWWLRYVIGMFCSHGDNAKARYVWDHYYPHHIPQHVHFPVYSSIFGVNNTFPYLRTLGMVLIYCGEISSSYLTTWPSTPSSIGRICLAGYRSDNDALTAPDGVDVMSMHTTCQEASLCTSVNGLTISRRPSLSRQVSSRVASLPATSWTYIRCLFCFMHSIALLEKIC